MKKVMYFFGFIIFLFSSNSVFGQVDNDEVIYVSYCNKFLEPGVTVQEFIAIQKNVTGGDSTVHIVVEILAPPYFTGLEVNQPSGINTGDGKIFAQAVSATDSKLKYSFSNGSTENFADHLNGGRYSVTVTDENGCQDSITNINLLHFEVTSVEGKIIMELIGNDKESMSQGEDAFLSVSSVEGTYIFNRRNIRWDSYSYYNQIVVPASGVYIVLLETPLGIVSRKIFVNKN